MYVDSGGNNPENDAGRETATKGLANGDGMVIIRMFELQITEVQGSLVGPPDFKSGVRTRGDGWVQILHALPPVNNFNRLSGRRVFGLAFFILAGVNLAIMQF